MNQGQREARNAAIKQAAKARAKVRTCPACGRGNALRSVSIAGLDNIVTCRWCPYERGRPF